VRRLRRHHGPHRAATRARSLCGRGLRLRRQRSEEDHGTGFLRNDGQGALYRYGPSRETARRRWITWGSAAAALLWIGASGAFSWYAANFGKFNETYGSLGAIIGFMTWLWISAIAVLLGAEVDAEMEHQTARDTTTGTSKPLGTRGARVADTVGGSNQTTRTGEVRASSWPGYLRTS
jgi:hypothetical protein